MKPRHLLLLLFLLGVAGAAQAQDTVIISIAKTSKIIFTIEDREDLEILKHYNFQDLFTDVIKKLEKGDTSDLVHRNNDRIATEETQSVDPTQTPDSTKDESMELSREERNDDWDKNDDDDDDDDKDRRRDDDENYDRDSDRDEWDVHFGSRRWGRTWQSFNFDLGTNNFLEDGKFPSSENKLYAVRPWGSWYLAMSSVQRTRMARKIFLEWSLGLSWYNFKFENDDVKIIKTDDGVVFERDDRDAEFIKSKLSASYLHASLVPVIDFGDDGRKHRFWNENGNAFRIGLGPYVAYRIGSHTKQVYNDGGREKDKDKDSFYLNNFRYGARLQVGYRSTDLFFNYDISELFASGKGPKLNAFSFGVIF
jgi:hypothetical protein